MKTLTQTFLIFFLLLEVLPAFKIDPYPIKNVSLTEVFSMNCLQMTQSQQMLKAYVMIGVKSKFQDPQKHLTQAIIDYDKRMYLVREYFHSHLNSSDIEAKASFDKALELWKINKKMLETSPTKENVLLIQKNFLEMINKLLEGTAPLATADLELISLTGKLCRKPMEVTIDYLIRMWGVEVKEYEKHIENTIAEYHINLKKLSKNKLNNEESQKLLIKAKNEFKFFEFMYRSKTKFIPSLLSKKADDNFLIIRKIKQIYKKQAH